MVHDILIMKRPVTEVAKKYFRSMAMVSNFVKKVGKKPNLLREMMMKRDLVVAKKETVQEVIEELLEEMTFIENIQQVRDELQRRHNMNVSVPVVREQMKEMGISYKKVKQISTQTNSDKSLVLR